MVETQTKINAVIGAIILLIGGYAVVGDDSLEPTHYCEERAIKAYCYSLSSTMKTCYTEMNKTGGKRCDIWKEIGGIESGPYIPKQSNVKQWLCNQTGCIPIDE